MKTKLLLVFCLIFPSSVMASEVISIADGDTLTIKENDQKSVVRLACIDAPESKQEGGAASTNRLKQLLPIGTIVNLEIVDTDRYGRTVAIVFKNNLNINLTMVQEGQAVVYPKYIDNCENPHKYFKAQNQAQIIGNGFWGLANRVMPWEWRASEQSTLKSVPIPPDSILYVKPTSVNVSSRANGGDLDCKDFKTQRAAQKVLDANRNDPHKLDQDKDGIACENLP
jgi:micrococcal nuclease